MPRFAASIQYDGSHYFGWQSLKTGLPTVQAAVEKSLSTVADHPVSVVCAGRTDARVHGSNQIIHFDSDSVRTERGWAYGANANLPDDIAVNWVKPVSDDFHARFSAKWRRYRYVIYNHPIRPAHLSKGVTWNYRPLDVARMKEAAEYLKGEHDFTSYRAIQCQAKNPVRTITRMDISRHGPLIVIDVQANAFLHHMIRNFAGVLMAIGCGKREPIWAKVVLDARDRGQGGVTASPCGLYFIDVGYDDVFGLPESESNPHFIAPLLPL
ncbi:tRNA pseudouridine(38-40) synthase TruA [Endozoicomonas ascidiicola]|uniref:tRNA pseudouridine(38-40) synthase TruA n=1 Tax=Endozoicomonas ascidiicola TaxID=1698521 RepID=UPI000836ECC0|nr:tRNA pseudouridine(38-40) synthase TruA [Endozoicomonas ascidiicola]